MTETQQTAGAVNPDSEKKQPPIVGWIIAIACLYFVFTQPDRAKNICLILLGFGSMIFIHELGHFLAAKAVGILVEEFAVGFGPALIGWQKVPEGIALRLLPKRHEDGRITAAATIMIPIRVKAPSDTVYQLRAVPLGGFVKMLGQEDLKAMETDSDPRNYNNKPVWQRMIVISAGVVFNIISGFLVFVYVYGTGFYDMPAIVGDVIPGSAAQRAGLEPGDEFVMIGEKQEHLSFSDLLMAGAFSGSDETIVMKVRGADGSEREISLMPEMNEAMGVKGFGIERPDSGVIAAPAGSDEAIARVVKKLEGVGLAPKDKIVAVNGEGLQPGASFLDALILEAGGHDGSALRLTAEREGEDGAVQVMAIEVPLVLRPRGLDPTKWLNLTPRTTIGSIMAGSPAEKAGLEAGDVIIRVGDQLNPTIQEIQAICQERVNRDVPVTVLRGDGREVAVTVRPQLQGGLLAKLSGKAKAMIGFASGYDYDSTVVADNGSVGQADSVQLDVPRGAAIQQVNGVDVKDWNALLVALERHQGQVVPVSYTPGVDSGTLNSEITVPEDFQANLFYRPRDDVFLTLPLLPYERLYKGRSLGESLEMGLNATGVFLGQTYMTFKALFTRQVKADKAISGPIGILSMSYQIVNDRPLNYFLYFLGMISMCIAVFNFLPLPILDGGHMVMLIIEKLKGSPVSVRAQEVVNMVGLVLIGSLFLYVTFNDIVRTFGG